MNPHVPPFGANDLRPGPTGAVELSKPAEMSENEALLAVIRVAAVAASLNMVEFSVFLTRKKKSLKFLETW